MKLLLLAVIAGSLAGCQAYLNHRAPPGEMAATGKVNQCNDYRTNPQACGESLYNAPRVARLALGQSVAQAREVMGRAPEERSLKTEDGQEVEVWSYLTDYANWKKSVIVFKGGRIVSIESMSK